MLLVVGLVLLNEKNTEFIFTSTMFGANTLKWWSWSWDELGNYSKNTSLAPVHGRELGKPEFIIPLENAPRKCGCVGLINFIVNIREPLHPPMHWDRTTSLSSICFPLLSLSIHTPSKTSRNTTVQYWVIYAGRYDSGCAYVCMYTGTISSIYICTYITYIYMYISILHT